MKEKLRIFFERLVSWKGLGVLNAVFMLVFIILSVLNFHPVYMMLSLFYLGYMALCSRGWIESELKEMYRVESEFHEKMARIALEKWKRYETMYGKLPPEEEEKENNQDNQEKEE